ncbi:MAG: 4-hydroxythreonine-4-phosphate dehydrogenase PdxA [Polyangiales bacterium]
MNGDRRAPHNLQLPLAITTGDPGGVGPEIALRVAVEAFESERLVIFGDSAHLRQQALSLGVPERALRDVARGGQLSVQPGELGLCDVGVPWSPAALAHHASPEGGRAQLATLDAAIDAARSGRVRAIVTAPMSKEAVHMSGEADHFRGHTEHLAQAAGLADDDVTMLFLGPRLRVGLVTTHLSIASAPAEITHARVLRAVRHTAQALLRAGTQAAAGGRRRPTLGVTGLNPHAGEAGLFGDEETRVIEPAMREAAQGAPFVDGQVVLKGPIPAETAFRIAAQGELDAVVAMLHDQATIPSKLLDWGDAVNVTWGLPFVRTSVDHGVAYAAALSGEIDSAGMRAALVMAQRHTARRHPVISRSTRGRRG